MKKLLLVSVAAALAISAAVFMPPQERAQAATPNIAVGAGQVMVPVLGLQAGQRVVQQHVRQANGAIVQLDRAEFP